MNMSFLKEFAIIPKKKIGYLLTISFVQIGNGKMDFLSTCYDHILETLTYISIKNLNEVEIQILWIQILLQHL
jgi:hypothetical protein